MAITDARFKNSAVVTESGSDVAAPIRPVFGSDRLPPGTCELPLGEAQQLWVGVQLHDSALLERAAAQCQRFTSLVSVEPPDELLLEVRGSLRLFGGVNALLAQLVAWLSGQGIKVRLAVMPTPSSALWSVRASPPSPASPDARAQIVDRIEELPQRLACVPLSCLRWPEEQTELLTNLGVQNVGDLMRLPRAGLARRLGRSWLQALDRGLGRCAEPRRAFHALQRYTDAGELETPLETAMQLEAFLSRRLQRLQQFLCSRQAAIGTLGIQLLHRTRPATHLQVATATPCADIERFCRLLRERLGQLKLAEPVSEVRLRSGPLFRHEPVNGSLLTKMAADVHADGTALAELVERLRARLGYEKASRCQAQSIPVFDDPRTPSPTRTAQRWRAGYEERMSDFPVLFGIRLSADHRPELAWRAVDVLSEERDIPPPESLFMRPVWLCPAPRLLAQDVREEWTVECGPERIESGWWDGKEVVRDYFVVRDRRGMRLWVYRDRQPPHRWYLHGLFG